MDKKKIRIILNIVFMIGAVVTILLYVTLENKQAFFYVGIASLCVKVAEFIIRLVP